MQTRIQCLLYLKLYNIKYKLGVFGEEWRA